MTRLYGRAPRGERLVEHTPHGHWHTTTMISAIRLTGVDAPMVIDGAMDSVVFRGYVEWLLAPTLHIGDIVVMDNLSSHKATGVREAIDVAHILGDLGVVRIEFGSDAHFIDSPEPTSFVLAFLALVSLSAARRRRRS